MDRGKRTLGTTAVVRDRSTENSGEGLARGDPLHRYAMPAAALLEETDERALLLVVQRGKRAVDECLSMILPHVHVCVAARDTAPLAASRIVVIARQVLTGQ